MSKHLIYLKGLFGNVPVGIESGGYSLVECPNKEADNVIRRYHYSRKPTTNRFLSLSVNKGMGYLQLGYGVRPAMKHTISTLITKTNYCEFDRMWLSDELPKYSESRVIGLLLSYLKQAYNHIKFLITYADESAGNSGVIYRATNAYELTPIQADFYILDDGERIHPVSLYHRHGTRAWAFLQKTYPNIKHIKGTAAKPVYQRRFLYILNRAMRKKYQERYACYQQEGSRRFRPSAQMKKQGNR